MVRILLHDIETNEINIFKDFSHSKRACKISENCLSNQREPFTTANVDTTQDAETILG